MFKGWIFGGVLVGSVVASSSFAGGIIQEDLDEFLKKFQQNTPEVMNQRVPKKRVDGTVIPEGKEVVFDREDLDLSKKVPRPKDSKKPKEKEGEMLQGNFTHQKLWWQKYKEKIKVQPSGRAGIGDDDRVEDLVDNPEKIIRSLDIMDQQGFTDATLTQDQRPWTDYYWPIYSGILGARYAEEGRHDLDLNRWIEAFPMNGTFPEARAYFTESFPLGTFLGLFLDFPERSDALDHLSPAEKYDLLVGNDFYSRSTETGPVQDTLLPFTQKMWDEGAYYQRNFGEVQRWMGICHGWAPASYMMKRPLYPVKVRSLNENFNITFYPSDIKALASLAWAEVPNIPNRFLGGRCNLKEDKLQLDKKTGRVVNQKCFDTNPGTWHMAVVNQIGKNNRSFVMDATFDYEVWNQPIVAYEYTYFNPYKMRATTELGKAKVKYDRRKDKFAAFRYDKRKTPEENYPNKPFKYLAGVAMKVTYVIEKQPSHKPQEDLLRTVEYVYDLEINTRGEIVGGEWYTNKHPDFLWAVPKYTKAQTNLEVSRFRELKELKELDPELEIEWTKAKLPQTWVEAAQVHAANKIPLYHIVEELIQRSRNANEEER